MKLSAQVLALLTLSLAATSLSGGCAEDGSDAEAPPDETADPKQDLAPLSEADSDGGTTEAPVADASRPATTDPKRTADPCPGCGLG